MLDYPHRPVLVNEALRDLITVSDGIYVDGTVGSGGHSEAIGERITGGGRLICLDRDSGVLALAEERLSGLGQRVTFVKANYADLGEVLQSLGLRKVDGILLDLGMSGFQLERSGRGFSFSRDEPLDMRMDPEEELTAHHLVNGLAPGDLEKILRDFGEERRARRIVRAIERERRKKPIDSSIQLAQLIRSAVPAAYRAKGKHPATRTFQALRIAVNRELDNLKGLLSRVPSLMAQGGRLVILSYHSLEDRIVKQAMAGWEGVCTCPPGLPVCSCGKKAVFKRVRRKGVKPSKEEIEDNPRARSAILRAAERI